MSTREQPEKTKKIEELSKEVHEDEKTIRKTLQQLLEKNETESVNEKLILAGEAKNMRTENEISLQV